MPDFGINCEQFAIDQQTDAAKLHLKNKAGGLQIKEKQLENSTNAMLGDVSNGNFRPILTTTFQDLIFQTFSSFSHGDTKATIKLIE